MIDERVGCLRINSLILGKFILGAWSKGPLLHFSVVVAF